MEEQPFWRPITILAMYTHHIDGMVETDEEQLANLEEVRLKPYVLDDATVSRLIQAFTIQRDDFWVFEEQLQRWKALELTREQDAEVTRLQTQMARLRQINSQVLTLAEDLSQGTIEKQLTKSDMDTGLEALLRMATGDDPFGD